MSSSSAPDEPSGLERPVAELHGRILELASAFALNRDLPSTVTGATIKTRLSESRSALRLDGFLLLLREPGQRRLAIAVADGVRGRTALALAASLGDTASGNAAELLNIPDMSAIAERFRDPEPPLEGAMLAIPLRTGEPEPAGYLVALSHRRGGIPSDVAAILSRVTDQLAHLVDAAMQQNEPEAGPRRRKSDPLLADRSVFVAELGQALRRSRRRRGDGGISILVLHVDSLRHVLQEEGAAAGEELLARVAADLRRILRGSDAVGRLGGGRFGAILTGCDGEGCRRAADKLRQLGRRLSTDTRPITVSIAGATATDSDPTPEHLLDETESRLDDLIAAGGNAIDTA